MTAPALSLGSAFRRIPSVRGRVPLYLSFAVLGIAFVFAIIGPWILPFDPDYVDLGAVLQPPFTDGHILGTDSAGRDILSRMIYGARLSMLMPTIIIVLSTVIGALIGMWSGWAGGATDALLSRVIDFLFAFPSLLIAMIAVALFGPGLVAPSVGLVIAYIPWIARVVRNLALQEKTKPYIEAYRVQGFAGTAIAVRMLLPNVAPIVLSQSALGFGYVVVDLAALSYLGLGVQPPSADWGIMVAQGQDALLQGVIWPVLLPSLAIVAVVVAVNTLGDALGDRLTGGQHES